MKLENVYVMFKDVLPLKMPEWFKEYLIKRYGVDFATVRGNQAVIPFMSSMPIIGNPMNLFSSIGIPPSRFYKYTATIKGNDIYITCDNFQEFVDHVYQQLHPDYANET